MVKPILHFKIRPKGQKPYFWVLLFNTKADMWAWHGNYCKKTGKQDEGPFGALVMPYEIVRPLPDGGEERKDNIGTVLFHKGLIGSGVVAHEMGHCAFWYDRLINGNTNAVYGESIGDDEERVLYLLAEFVQQTVKAFYKAKIY